MAEFGKSQNMDPKQLYGAVDVQACSPLLVGRPTCAHMCQASGSRGGYWPHQLSLQLNDSSHQNDMLHLIG